ncbi:prohead protease/major capsid protein fusion protein [Ochrobactrum sp. MYb379]|uniref:prohead protease/major capsid protein fusion protein n=1 Tax=Ochrobactrum sp. MYb379 TaxID=2745275 RepID=UPI003095C692
MSKPETFTRAAPVSGSANADDRTVEIVFASSAAVKRYSYEDGYYSEVLAISKDSIDVSRMNEGMSLLDTHDQYSMDSRLGSVVPGSFRIEGDKALCRVKFSRREKSDQFFQDILDGHKTPVSVGYRILETTRTEGAGDALPTVTATRWMPLEVSIVPIPADASASTRSEEETFMPNETTTTEQRQHAPNNIVNERRRISDIRAAGRSARLEDSVIDQAIERGDTVDSFRNHVFEVLVARQNETPTFAHVETPTGRNTNIRSAMADALMVRIDPAHKPQNDSREFIGLSLGELARRSLDATGVATRGLSTGEVITRALHSTSDFGHVISQTGQTVLAASYAAVPSGIKAIARQTSARDFRLKTTARLSGFSDLEAVNESGEFKRGTFAEGAEGYKIATFGKVFAMTRQMLVNDDLGAFADVSRELGLSAARLEADVLAKLVNGNPLMSDGKPVFHADHKNLGAGAALSEASLSAARLAMARQVGLAGELIDVTPVFLVVAPEQLTAAEKILAAIQPANSENVNPFAGKLQLVVDRRLTAGAWYLVASPGLVPSLEYAYLEGAAGPQFDTRLGFDVDGVEVKVRVDFGAGWTDHRGWYKNPGQ